MSCLEVTKNIESSITINDKYVARGVLNAELKNLFKQFIYY